MLSCVRTMLTVWHTGFMRVFFKKMGIENLRFKPAYNPYTEVGPFHSSKRDEF